MNKKYIKKSKKIKKRKRRTKRRTKTMKNKIQKGGSYTFDFTNKVGGQQVVIPQNRCYTANLKSNFDYSDNLVSGGGKKKRRTRKRKNTRCSLLNKLGESEGN